MQRVKGLGRDVTKASRSLFPFRPGRFGHSSFRPGRALAAGNASSCVFTHQRCCQASSAALTAAATSPLQACRSCSLFCSGISFPGGFFSLQTHSQGWSLGQGSAFLSSPRGSDPGGISPPSTLCLHKGEARAEPRKAQGGGEEEGREIKSEHECG